jgi:hypothetical protein
MSLPRGFHGGFPVPVSGSDTGNQETTNIRYVTLTISFQTSTTFKDGHKKVKRGLIESRCGRREGKTMRARRLKPDAN